MYTCVDSSLDVYGIMYPREEWALVISITAMALLVGTIVYKALLACDGNHLATDCNQKVQVRGGFHRVIAE